MTQRTPADFSAFRRQMEGRTQEPSPPTDEELREKLRDLRPDLDGTRGEISRKESVRRMRLRLRLLHYLGDALLAGYSAAGEVGVALAYERLYAVASEGTDEPVMVDPIEKPVEASSVIDVGMLASAALMLRMVRSAANPGTDGPQERELFRDAHAQRMAYFRQTLPALTEAISQIDSLLDMLAPGATRYLDITDADMLEESSRRAETRAASYQREVDEPDEEPEALRRAETEQIPPAVLEGIQGALERVLGANVSVEVVRVERLPREDGSVGSVEPESGEDASEDGE